MTHRTVLGTFLLVGSLVIAVAHASPSAGEMSAAEMRRRVKEGRINTCVTDKIASEAPDPILVFKNHCDVPVNVTLCVKPADEERAYYTLRLRAKSEARHRLWMKSASFTHRYNSCEKPYCSAPEPDC